MMAVKLLMLAKFLTGLGRDWDFGSKRGIFCKRFILGGESMAFAPFVFPTIFTGQNSGVFCAEGPLSFFSIVGISFSFDLRIFFNNVD